MGIKEDVEDMKKSVLEVKNQETSLAMSLLHDLKKQNKRQFITILVILVMWFLTIGYLVYLLNDIGTEEIIDIQDVNNIDDSDIQLGDR